MNSGWELIDQAVIVTEQVDIVQLTEPQSGELIVPLMLASGMNIAYGLVVAQELNDRLLITFGDPGHHYPALARLGKIHHPSYRWSDQATWWGGGKFVLHGPGGQPLIVNEFHEVPPLRRSVEAIILRLLELAGEQFRSARAPSSPQPIHKAVVPKRFLRGPGANEMCR